MHIRIYNFFLSIFLSKTPKVSTVSDNTQKQINRIYTLVSLLLGLEEGEQRLKRKKLVLVAICFRKTVNEQALQVPLRRVV